MPHAELIEAAEEAHEAIKELEDSEHHETYETVFVKDKVQGEEFQDSVGYFVFLLAVILFLYALVRLNRSC